jgi:hypothetical protein
VPPTAGKPGAREPAKLVVQGGEELVDALWHWRNRIVCNSHPSEHNKVRERD